MSAITPSLLHKIRNRLIACPGVLSANVMPSGDGGVSAFVVGGTDDDVALTLWYAVPAGILTRGENAVTILDSSRRPHLLRFTRA